MDYRSMGHLDVLGGMGRSAADVHPPRPLMEGSRFFGTASWSDLWGQSSEFRRIWRVSSVLWGMALLADASIRVLMAYILPVSVVPALAGALYPVTFVMMQLVTNVYFHRAGLYRMLGARWVQVK